MVSNIMIALKRGDLRGVYQLIRVPFYSRFNRYIDRKFESRFGVDTGGFVLKTDLTIHSANKTFGGHHAPTPVRVFNRMMMVLPKDLRDFTFIDFGSGKGRVLLLASNYNFQNIIGVEYAEELHAIAQKNIAIYKNKKQKCLRVASMLADATTFPIPPGKCVFFFYNPFKESVMSRVLTNIQDSYMANPRKMYFMYYNPVLSTLFDSLPFIRRTEHKSFSLQLLSPDPKLNFMVYETSSYAELTRKVTLIP